MATDLAKERAARNLRKQSTAPAGGPLQLKHGAGGGKFSHEKMYSDVDEDNSDDSDERSISSVSQIEEVPSGAPGVRLENTYQLGPAGRRFPVGEARRILADVMHDYLTEERYEEEFARSMSQSISQVIRARIKELRSAGRYKIVVLVSIGMTGAHGMSIASRCLWNDAVDNFVTYQFRNNSLYAVATVFAVYQE